MQAHYSDLAGKTVVITGGTKGIGFATAELLVRNDARVVINGRDPAATEAAAQELRSRGGEVLGVAADVSDPDGLAALHDAVRSEFGSVNGLVTFAGGFHTLTPLHDIGIDEWETVIRDNLTSTFTALRAFLPEMAKAGRGSVVTMASNAGRLLDMPLTASYAAAKAGVVMLSRHAALEYGPRGVRVNCVAPATTLSPRVAKLLSDEMRIGVAQMSPLGRIGMPEDTANATAFLLSEASEWLTGITLDVAGGRVMM